MNNLIDRLTADLRPVRRRSPRRDLLLLLALGVAETIFYLLLRGMRPDMDAAMVEPSFWWKAGSLAVLVVVGGVTAFGSFDPAGSPRRGLRAAGIVAALVLASGWMIDAAGDGGQVLLDRLAWRDGIDCLFAVVVLSLPPILALGLMMRRGAPTDPRRTASAVGLTAAAWGGLVFVFRCPHDDPLYIVFWFAASILLVVLAARLILPRLARW